MSLEERLRKKFAAKQVGGQQEVTEEPKGTRVWKDIVEVQLFSNYVVLWRAGNKGERVEEVEIVSMSPNLPGPLNTMIQGTSLSVWDASGASTMTLEKLSFLANTITITGLVRK